MNKFGEFLYTLRREKGMTQAELAGCLGVTNKAVSKWETGEAMPETSLLLPIANIFGVTVDELLNGRRAEKADNTAAEESDERKTVDIINSHMFVRGKDDVETPLERVCGAVCAALILCGVAVYLFLGAFAGLWHPYWIIIPACALCCGLAGIVFSLCDRSKRRKSLEAGKNPYTDGACGVIMLLSIITYLLLGALADLWHPYWVIIVAAAAVCGVVGAVGNAVISKKR